MRSGTNPVARHWLYHPTQPYTNPYKGASVLAPSTLQEYWDVLLSLPSAGGNDAHAIVSVQKETQDSSRMTGCSTDCCSVSLKVGQFGVKFSREGCRFANLPMGYDSTRHFCRKALNSSTIQQRPGWHKDNSPVLEFCQATDFCCSSDFAEPKKCTGMFQIQPACHQAFCLVWERYPGQIQTGLLL